MTELHEAVFWHVEFRKWEVVHNILQDRRVTVNRPGGVYDTILPSSQTTSLLHLVVHGANGDGETAKLLLKLGADIEAKDYLGITPLHVACKTGGQFASILVGGGANIDSHDEGQRTPLSYAAEHGHLNAVKLLCEHGASIDSIDELGQNILFYAASKGKTEVVSYLKGRGADDDHCDIFGQVAAQSAATSGWLDTFKFMFESYGIRADINWPLYAFQLMEKDETVSDERCAETIGYLMENCFIDIDDRDFTESTLLHVAVRYRRKTTVEFLLRRGANPFVRNGEGKMPWQIARENAWLWPSSLISRFGCDLDEETLVIAAASFNKDRTNGLWSIPRNNSLWSILDPAQIDNPDNWVWFHLDGTHVSVSSRLTSSVLTNIRMRHFQ